MLHGTNVALRARVESDVSVLHAGLHDDVETRLRESGSAWQPISPLHSPFAVPELSADVAPFTVVRRESDEVLGATALWGIDTHNRVAHIGISRLPIEGRASVPTPSLCCVATASCC